MVGHDGALLLPGGPSSGPFPDQRRAAYHRRSRPRGSHDAAEGALRRFLEGEAGGFNADSNQSVADYLTVWLAAKALVLKPTAIARYRDYVHNDLVPAFGTLKLDELGHRHIAAFVTSELAAGRGQTTLYRCLATLSSALGAAFRQHRLAHNPASPSALHRPPSPERRSWTADEAVRFLQHCHQADPDMADLFEFLISTGMRKGEALGLHRYDVHLPERVLYVRCEAGVPRITVHDLRHLGATITITAGVPLTVVSKTLRHSTLDHREHLQPPHPTSRPRSRRHHRPHTHRSREDRPPDGPAGVAATTTRPHPAPPRSPPPAPLPRPARVQHYGGQAPNRACDHTATTRTPGMEKAALSRMRERPPTCMKHGRDDRI
ncbi:tyrosine-type recombinase/integrase [Streptomyces sp. NRRL F-2580]|uniref:tyrosine-type recombinase/integrase n=1 Tax=Streptomyces sp. NRRL F-2580 TaxID=1463841 RepID=UPI0004C992CE|nr:site-specific integrase [Streptomyces sp. NRRL F-2580]